MSGNINQFLSLIAGLHFIHIQECIEQDTVEGKNSFFADRI